MSTVLWRLLSPSFALLTFCLKIIAGSTIQARDGDTTKLAAPLSFEPYGQFDGIDGSWTSFALRIGTPPQVVRVFASWISHQIWVVLPQGCNAAAHPSACVQLRGGTFNPASSSTWNDIGVYYLGVDHNLDYTGNADYGHDVVGLGQADSDGPTVKNAIVGGIAVEDFFLGMFGLNPRPSNFSNLNEMSTSLIDILQRQNHIPSVSFGYTAGAHYRQSGVLGSLTLGGYDAARIVENDISFEFAGNGESDTVVALHSISTGSRDPSNPVPVGLLPSIIGVTLDATVAELWLPTEVCKAFEQEFGLVYDSNTQLYLVNDTLHSTLLQRNPNITFDLSPIGRDADRLTISLPYAAFDLTASSPYRGLSASSKYFPLRRATTGNQYTLGRTFFQEAYISVDYGTNQFNISQVSWNSVGQQDLVVIPSSASKMSSPASGNSSSSKSGFNAGAIAGIVVGAIAAIVLAALLFTWLWRRHNLRRSTGRELGSEMGSSGQLSEKPSPKEASNEFPQETNPEQKSIRRPHQSLSERGKTLPPISESALDTPASTKIAAPPHRKSRGRSGNGTGSSTPIGSGRISYDTDTPSSRTLVQSPDSERETVARHRAFALAQLASTGDPPTESGSVPATIHETPGDAAPITRVEGMPDVPERSSLREQNFVRSLLSRAGSRPGTALSDPQRISYTSSPIGQSSTADDRPVSPLTDRGKLASTLHRSFSWEDE